MTKPRVAFVASGGALKGIAHLGVLKAMQELEIEADVFVGASTGALVAACVAQGLSTEELLDWLRPSWRRQNPVRGLRIQDFWGLPSKQELQEPSYLLSGLFSLQRFETHLAQAMPCDDFRSLDKDVLITAADVDGRGRVVFGRGYREDIPISQAVAASCAVPVLFRPVRIGERYLVDGELVRTLSLDLAIGAGADVMIISNVYRPVVRKLGSRSIVHEGATSVARQALNVVLAEKEKRGIDLISRMYPNVHVLPISPDLGKFSFTSRRHLRVMLQRAYHEALSVLAKAKRRGVFDTLPNVNVIGRA